VIKRRTISVTPFFRPFGDSQWVAFALLSE
jgi:hypothetical protein